MLNILRLLSPEPKPQYGNFTVTISDTPYTPGRTVIPDSKPDFNNWTSDVAKSVADNYRNKGR